MASGQRPNVNAEQVLWHLVQLFSYHDDPTLKTKVGRLARSLIDYQPDFYRLLSTRRKALDKAIQGKIETNKYYTEGCESTLWQPALNVVFSFAKLKYNLLIQHLLK